MRPKQKEGFIERVDIAFLHYMISPTGEGIRKSLRSYAYIGACGKREAIAGRSF